MLGWYDVHLGGLRNDFVEHRASETTLLGAVRPKRTLLGAVRLKRTLVAAVPPKRTLLGAVHLGRDVGICVLRSRAIS